MSFLEKKMKPHSKVQIKLNKLNAIKFLQFSYMICQNTS